MNCRSRPRRGKRLTDISRRLVHGGLHRAPEVRPATQVILGVVHTAEGEVRRTRTPARQVEHLEAAMFWIGGVYPFWHVHGSLEGTPAMAADLTDQVGSGEESIGHRCA